MTRAGSVNNAQMNCSTPLTANPTIRNGSRSSHTIGYSTRARMASGQHRTSRMHHNRNFVMAYRTGYGYQGEEVQRKSGWSGRRDSNPRHQTWQGCTLPAELLPRRRLSIVARRDRGCQFSTSSDPAGYRDWGMVPRSVRLHLCVNVFEVIRRKPKKASEKKIVPESIARLSFCAMLAFLQHTRAVLDPLSPG